MKVSLKSKRNEQLPHENQTGKVTRKKWAWMLGVLVCGANAIAGPNDSAWTKIWDNNLAADWTPYFAKKGILNPDSSYKVSPEGYLFMDVKLPFSQLGFGHLFYTKRKYSYYIVRATYRFTSEGYFTPDWAQGWNRQNNGIMLHSEDPKGMNNKEFPNSIEVQLLGPKNEQNTEKKEQGFKYATSANLCTPGTFVAYKANNNFTQHCTAAEYPAAWKNTEIPWEDKEGWSDVTARVLSDSLIQHYIHGVKVLEYTKMRLDNGTPYKEGFISVQAEGTATQFKSIEVLDLEGCMDATKPQFKSYFVKSKPSDCTGPTGLKNEKLNAEQIALGRAFEISTQGLKVQWPSAYVVTVSNLQGKVLGNHQGNGLTTWNFNTENLQLLMVRVRLANGTQINRLWAP